MRTACGGCAATCTPRHASGTAVITGRPAHVAGREGGGLPLLGVRVADRQVGGALRRVPGVGLGRRDRYRHHAHGARHGPRASRSPHRRGGCPPGRRPQHRRDCQQQTVVGSAIARNGRPHQLRPLALTFPHAPQYPDVRHKPAICYAGNHIQCKLGPPALRLSPRPNAGSIAKVLP